jgi:hypothetical protein
MLLISIFSGIGIVAIALYLFFGERNRIKDNIRATIGLSFFIIVFIFTVVLEINGQDKVIIREKVIVSDYFEIGYNTVLRFNEPTKVKIIEYDTPSYIVTTHDRVEYEVIK